MTTAPVLDEREHFATLAAAVQAHEDDLPVFDYGKTPQPLPPIFVRLSIERTFVAATKAGLATRSGWRAEFRVVGRTPSEAQWARLRLAEAIDGARLVFDGVESTAITHESSERIAPDDGRHSGLTYYTYTL